MKNSKWLLTFVFVFLFVAIPAHAATKSGPRTSTAYLSEGTGGVDVIPYVKSDKRGLFVDFENFNKNIDHVYYNLTYNQKDNGILGGVEGSFFPHVTPYSGVFNGKNFIRREILFGSCSGKTCHLHKVKNVTLTVKTYLKSGKVGSYTKVIKFANDQF